MTTRQADKLATAMLSHIPLVEARVDDPRVLSGELMLVSEMQKDLARDLRRLWDDLEQMCDEGAKECEGKSAKEISELWGRKLATLKRQYEIYIGLDLST